MGLNFEIMNLAEAKSGFFILFGMILTILGIVFTIIGTIKQGKENDEFQSKISESSKKNIDLSEKLAEQTKLASDKLALQNEKSTNKILELSNKNSELTQKLTLMSEEKFRKLTVPSLNVLRVEENSKSDLNSYFKIIVKNTGNNDCTNASLIIDKHNSPFVPLDHLAVMSTLDKLPKDATQEYIIPFFQNDLASKVADDNKKKEFQEFIKNFQSDKIAIVVMFHFDYQWNNETLSSSQYTIVKMVNRPPFISSSENHVKSDFKMPHTKYWP